MNKRCLRSDKLFVFTTVAAPAASQSMVAQTKRRRVCSTLLHSRRRAAGRAKESDDFKKRMALAKIPETREVLLRLKEAINTTLACSGEEDPLEAQALSNKALDRCSFDRKHRLTAHPLAGAPDQLSWSSNCEKEFITFFTSTDSFEIGHFFLQRLLNDLLMYLKCRADSAKEGKTATGGNLKAIRSRCAAIALAGMLGPACVEAQEPTTTGVESPDGAVRLRLDDVSLFSQSPEQPGATMNGNSSLPGKRTPKTTT